MPCIAVLGGGAAGLAAAIAAAETAPDCRVVLVERNPRVGKKLLATGNGRCNLDNANPGAEHYSSADPKALARLLQAAAQADPLGWFADHGLYTRQDEAGRVYPYSNQAADVLNLLLGWLQRTGVEVKTDCGVKTIRQTRQGYAVQLTDGSTLNAHRVICALGGSAGPQFGTDGFGPAFAAACGLRVEPVYPALVPLACGEGSRAGLAGIRVKAAVTLTEGDRVLGREEGEVQFTEQGLSGIAVMSLSRHLRPGGKQKKAVLSLDLFPQLDEAALCRLLTDRPAALPGVTLGEVFTGLLNRRVGAALCRRAALPADSTPAAALTAPQWAALAHVCKQWEFEGLTALGWQQAQVTGGGIALGQLNADFSVQGLPGLYFVGETLDCAGDCGGYNLHWAFASGLAAGRSAARKRTRSEIRPAGE